MAGFKVLLVPVPPGPEGGSEAERHLAAWIQFRCHPRPAQVSHSVPLLQSGIRCTLAVVPVTL